MKKLILGVSCINESFDAAPDYFVVELSSGQIARIEQLAKVAIDQDVYSIEYFDYSGEYFSCGSLETLSGNDDTPICDITESMVSDLYDETGRVETNQIVVYKDGFRFTAIPKHCGESEGCCTRKVSISDLSSFRTLVNID
ncbi:hypothetical protein EA007_00340 [Vibrio anguillarum]|uniref:hypothetical protein n=1 Tax=Vibrio anguillarum TaxID=55601 RepID=UPI00188D66A8|nr:hypothetical protein [Vibrio anguillarum]MBF4249479.1 hypothetical protein [Vibrio anguillarum]